MTKNKKKNVIKLVTLLVILVAVCVSIVFYFFGMQKTNQTVATPEAKIAAIIEQASNDEQTATEGKKQLKQLADNEPNKDAKGQYLAAAVDLYINTGDTAGAQQIAEQYEQNDSSALSAAALAKSYEDARDYKNAAKYYGIAAERSPKSASPTERSNYNDYMLQKQAMEAMAS